MSLGRVGLETREYSAWNCFSCLSIRSSRALSLLFETADLFAVCFLGYNIQSCCTAGLDNLPERLPEKTSDPDRRYCWKDRSKAAAYGGYLEFGQTGHTLKLGRTGRGSAARPLGAIGRTSASRTRKPEKQSMKKDHGDDTDIAFSVAPAWDKDDARVGVDLIKELRRSNTEDGRQSRS
ncbi:hypothetical protein Tco_0497183 [Tanacetum coccineum]